MIDKQKILNELQPKIVKFKEEKLNGGPHYVIAFKNGYGASIIKNPYSYGGNQGLMEIALLEILDIVNDNIICHLKYDKNRFTDVIGWLDDNEIIDCLKYISRKRKRA